MTGAPLSFTEVRFAYPRTEVFDSLSLTVGEGEFVGVLGPNGSGKTTLLRLATGIVRAARGGVRLDGQDVNEMAAREIARRVAVVPQEEHSLFALTVLEMVLLGRHPWLRGFGFESNKDRRIAMECLAAVQAEHLAGRFCGDLSGGERQRVTLARALAQEARLLILDEPTSHLDLRHQVAILRLLAELREKQGLTVVVISHDLNLAARFAERLVLLGEGGVLASGTPAEVLEPEVLSRAYGTEVAVRRVEGVDVPQVFPE